MEDLIHPKTLKTQSIGDVFSWLVQRLKHEDFRLQLQRSHPRHHL